MQAGFVAESSFGYFQAAAASIDTAQLLSVALGAAGAVALARGPVLLLIIPEGQAIRWRDDGVAPTAAVGQPLAVGAELRYTAKNLANLRVIGQAANAILNVTVYGHGQV